ncbi:MAG TPA: hypothetical protein VMB03_17140 [Bryobacteraceae bacterium]|nr:hypothetical protein [Bryobacteraceae bacterium]
MPVGEIRWTPGRPASIDAAVRKLELQFQPRKFPVDVLVVDHIERTPGEH